MPRPPSSTPVPTIACFNCATTPLGVDFEALIAALQTFVDEHFAPVWATPAKLVRTRGFRRGAWAIVFHDTYSDASTEGYHDVTPEGLPMSRVYVKNILRQKDQVSVAASHELAEMLVDPLANFYTIGPRPNRLYDYEVADPVEELFFAVDALTFGKLRAGWKPHSPGAALSKGGGSAIHVTNFVYPAYFEVFHKPRSTRFDHMETLTRPFELHEGGYQSYWSEGKERTEWGSKAKRARFKLEDRTGHRSEMRHKTKRKLSTAPFC